MRTRIDVGDASLTWEVRKHEEHLWTWHIWDRTGQLERGRRMTESEARNSCRHAVVRIIRNRAKAWLAASTELRAEARR